MTLGRGDWGRQPKPWKILGQLVVKGSGEYPLWVQARVIQLPGLEGQSCERRLVSGASAWCSWQVPPRYWRVAQKEGWAPHSQVATKPWKLYTWKPVAPLHVKNISMSEFILTATNLCYGQLALNLLGNSLIGYEENFVIKYIFVSHDSEGKLPCKPFQNIYQLKNLIIWTKESNQACHLVVHVSLFFK